MTLNNFAVCRMCVKETRVMISLFGEDALWRKLKSISNVEISEGDDLPQQVCMNCARDAINAYKTKSKCEKADQILRRAISDSTFNLRSVDIAVLMNETSQVTDDTNTETINCPTTENVFSLIGIKQEIVDSPEDGEETIFPCEPLQNVTKVDTERDSTSAWTTTGASTSDLDCPAENENINVERRNRQENDDRQQIIDNEPIEQELNESAEGSEPNLVFECTVCKKFYKRKFFFERHISTGLCSKRTETPKCIECNEVFRSNHHLGSHRRFKHCANMNNMKQEGPESIKKKTVEHNYFIQNRKRRIRKRRKKLLFTRRKREKPIKETVDSTVENGKEGENETTLKEGEEEALDEDDDVMDEDVNFPSPINEEDINGLERLMELHDVAPDGIKTPIKIDFGCQVCNCDDDVNKECMDMDANDLKTRYLKRKLILSFKKDKTGKYFHSFSKGVNDSFPSNETLLNESVKSKERKPRGHVDASKYEQAKKLINESTTVQELAQRLDVSKSTGYRIKKKLEREILQKDEPESGSSAEETQVEQKFDEHPENSILNNSGRKRKHIDRQTYDKALLLEQADAPMKVWPVELGIGLSTAFCLRRKIRNKEVFCFKKNVVAKPQVQVQVQVQERPKRKRQFISEETYKKALSLTDTNVPTKEWPDLLGICRSTASYLRRKIRLGEPFSSRQNATKKIKQDVGNNENDDCVDINALQD